MASPASTRATERALAGRHDLIVVDIATGDLLDRVDTGSRIANGMFLTAGGSRDVYYCTTTTLARVVWT